ncbi:nucleotide exchange factor GrpE [Paenibacillus thalictri]|uniref:Protein GrpE n=1 Tax=Paenibacillus thalictri TaxID=2527873 RepID=A0A4Q9DF41_9BACL|nr:nucleotide exchange factor GrpE [Paenibacillus thalictri]TBL70423.1 nucleotide exchange factor GrpE [Paenibacillus thalictri]
MNTEEKEQGHAGEEELAAKQQAGEQNPEGADTGEQTASEEQGGVHAELAAALKLAEENNQRFLRAQADFDNFRRRTRDEKEQFAKYASLKLIEQLLPVVDNFERALATSKDNKDFDALLKGLDMTFRQLDQVLATEGLQRMETVGTPFNPEFHQAVMQVESEEHEEGTIVEEMQKGYILKDKVIRPAMVKVSM